MESRRERLHALGEHHLKAARTLIASVCKKDSRFGALVAESGVGYEFGHDYGMGTFLVATARQKGSLPHAPLTRPPPQAGLHHE